ncbi:hypothetical protein SALB1_1184 [Salinisphaera sp. LB1]|nr:hypothetical protein SALB1_1184 [Salinisphaera sp. LB1]
MHTVGESGGRNTRHGARFGARLSRGGVGDHGRPPVPAVTLSGSVVESGQPQRATTRSA